jgi:hypothetical protein
VEEIKGLLDLPHGESFSSGSIDCEDFVAVNQVKVSFKAKNLFHLFQVPIYADHLSEDSR